MFSGYKGKSVFHVAFPKVSNYEEIKVNDVDMQLEKSSETSLHTKNLITECTKRTCQQNLINYDDSILLLELFQ